MPPYDEETVKCFIEENTLPELRCLLTNKGVCEELARQSFSHPHILRASCVEAIRRLKEGVI